MEIKFFKKKKKFIKGGSWIRPDFFWKCILLMVFILILLSCAFGFYLFTNVNKESTSLVIDTNEQELIKKERFENVLKYFTEREKKSTEIRNSPSPIIDPSL